MTMILPNRSTKGTKSRHKLFIGLHISSPTLRNFIFYFITRDNLWYFLCISVEQLTQFKRIGRFSTTTNFEYMHQPLTTQIIYVCEFIVVESQIKVE